jgi:hypothetical protein
LRFQIDTHLVAVLVVPRWTARPSVDASALRRLRRLPEKTQAALDLGVGVERMVCPHPLAFGWVEKEAAAAKKGEVTHGLLGGAGFFSGSVPMRVSASPRYTVAHRPYCRSTDWRHDREDLADVMSSPASVLASMTAILLAWLAATRSSA